MARSTGMVRDRSERLLSWALPAVCATPDGGATLGLSPTLCPDCWAGVSVWSTTRCRRYGTPASSEVGACPHCRSVLYDGLTLRFVRAATWFEGAIREAIHHYKYDPRPGLADRLAGLIVQAGLPAGSWDEYAALVLLHRVRRAERGFCQATALAKAIGRATGLPVEGRWVRRVRPTAPMWQLGGLDGRRREVEGAFEARLPPSAADRAIVLVDDVVTTG